MRLNYAIVFVSDMARSVAFYRDVLGIALRFESPGWTEFATEGATLALHAGQAQVERAGSNESSAGTCRPGIGVPNIAQFHARMLAAGVRCIQEPTETFGVKIAQYCDPDGLPISVAEERQGR